MAKIKRYKIGNDGKLILIGEIEDRTITEAGSFRINIDEKGTVALVEGKTGATKAEVEAEVRNAFKRLRPDATERELDIMAMGKAPEEKNTGWIK